MSQRPELIIGFVGPVGVRLRDLINRTDDYLRRFKYRPVEIRLSKLLERYVGYTPQSSNSENERILHGQTMGHEFREKLNDAAGLALAALVAIREERIKLSSEPDKPVDAVAYLLNQLKHPNEVKLLRQIYGSSFVLIAAHATKATRQENLVRQIAESENRTVNEDDAAKAAEVIRIDDEEPALIGADDLGQNTRNTYPLADMFVNLESKVGEFEVERFIDLLFGHPFHTPQPDEVAMYLASAGALRSSEESRQVGAVIVNVKRDKRNKTSNIDVIATGMNEVPMRGGGFYWDGAPNSPDARDQFLIAYGPNDDRALTIKKEVLRELVDILKRMDWFKESIESTQTPDLLKKLIPDGLKGTQFMNIGEFQRQVHAEMAALIDGARRGVAVDGQTMYVTTFPCHNCAKHIIAAGLKYVVYLEPYPKSRAEMLHKEEIEFESKDGAPSDEDQGVARGDKVPKVVFSPYTGIAPLQHQRLFSMLSRGKKNGIALKEWDNNRATLSPQHLVRNAFASYLMAERQELTRLPVEKFKWDPSIVCPSQNQ
jgi:deoxycytidylate deaminase